MKVGVIPEGPIERVADLFGYEIHRRDGAGWLVEVVESGEVALRSLDARLPLSSVYEGVSVRE